MVEVDRNAGHDEDAENRNETEPLTEGGEQVRLPHALLRLPELVIVSLAGRLNPQGVRFRRFVLQLRKVVRVGCLFAQVEVLVLVYLGDDECYKFVEVWAGVITRFVSW